jgi:response regulator of citrate/malate metabolism
MKMLKQILLIDDNLADNEFHEITIRDAKLTEEVKSFSDTRKAMQYLKEAIETDTNIPELIFLDILMPKKDGFAFIKELKAVLVYHQEAKSKMKIFMLSGNYDPVMEMYLNSPNYDDLVKGYRAKPLTKEMLFEICKQYF